jgi:hypothetical protein
MSENNEAMGKTLWRAKYRDIDIEGLKFGVYSDRVVLGPFDHRATMTSDFAWMFEWQNVLCVRRPVQVALNKIPSVYLYTVHLPRKSRNIKLHMILLCVIGQRIDDHSAPSDPPQVQPPKWPGLQPMRPLEKKQKK